MPCECSRTCHDTNWRAAARIGVYFHGALDSARAEHWNHRIDKRRCDGETGRPSIGCDVLVRRKEPSATGIG